MKFVRSLAAFAPVIALAVSGAAAEMPPAADIEVDFDKHIWPIFEAKCIECHGPDKQKSGLRMDTEEFFKKGGTEGPAAIPGDSANSLMIGLVLGTNDDFDIMPPKTDPLTPEQVGLLRAWIDQGLKWGEGGAPAAAPTESYPDKAGVEALGNAWKVEATKQDGPLATWDVVSDIEAPDGGQVIALTSPNHTSGGSFNLLWSPVKKFMNGSLTVKVKSISGEEDQGGGLMWRTMNKDNYYIARYNPLEKNLRLYKVVEGDRSTIASADVDFPADQWAELVITQQGDAITVSINGDQVIEASDDTFKRPGGIGYWTKADAATAFTEIVITK